MGYEILVSVFDTEPMAFEGLSALKNLHRDGDITLYASTVIAKDPLGNVAVRQEADRGPVGSLVGVVTGGLVGVLGGPVGLAVGAYVGGFGGLMYDLFKAGVSLDFVDEVSASLAPGKAAVIADIDENLWVTPVDTRLAALGGTTFHRRPGDVVEADLIRETDAARQQLEHLKDEMRESSGEAKANVQKAIDAQKRKLKALTDKADEALAKQQAEFEARLATLREQQSKAKEGQKQKIEARIDKLKASHEARKAKLAESTRLAKESLDATRDRLIP